MEEFILILLSYLLGSIPSALIISKKYFDIDIREHGSGNMGSTNVFRVLGSRFGAIVLMMDITKGLMAVLLCFIMPYYQLNIHEDIRTQLMIGLGLAAVLGHIFPIFANFRGGKGVATVFGMLLGLQPIIAISCIGVFMLFLYLTRFVSLSSMMAAIFFPICVLWIWNDHVILYRVFAIIIALLVIASHHKNIGKILRGSESRANILKNRDKRKSKK